MCYGINIICMYLKFSKIESISLGGTNGLNARRSMLTKSILLELLESFTLVLCAKFPNFILNRSDVIIVLGGGIRRSCPT